jgi:hypothetical protein
MMILPVSGSATFSVRRSLCIRLSDRADSAQEWSECERPPGGRRIELVRTRCRLCPPLRMIKEEMRRRMHQPIPKQGKWLHYVARGYL